MKQIEYEQVLAVARAATREFAAAQSAYRARKIGDAEYLAARAIYQASDRAFSEARGEEY